jgi:hypothetical protein
METINAESKIKPRFLRQAQLAEALNICERQVRYWQEKRIIPFIKIGRATLFDLDKVVCALEKFERKAGYI